MTPEHLDALLGLPRASWEKLSSLAVYLVGEDGPEFLGDADSMAGAIQVMVDKLGEEGPIDHDGYEEMPTLEGLSALEQVLFWELSPEMLMERSFATKGLYYLLPVIEENPDLRLLVAWEAVPHRQDFAMGIFTRQKK